MKLLVDISYDEYLRATNEPASDLRQRQMAYSVIRHGRPFPMGLTEAELKEALFQKLTAIEIEKIIINGYKPVKKIQHLDGRQSITGMTNGEVMALVFPGIIGYSGDDGIVQVHGLDTDPEDVTLIMEDWWNAPYEGGVQIG